MGIHYPNLIHEPSLFPEFRRSNPDLIGHRGYRKLAREIAMLEKGLFSRTKFERMIRYRCVDACYLVIRAGIAAEHEVPSGWGLLECDLESGDGECVLVRQASWNEAAAHHRLELLHSIAVKAGQLS